jgi:ABC-type iron transport system FetAB permease component
MGFGAVALVILGFAVGTMFRITVLLPILLLLLIVTIAFSVVQGFSLLEGALVVFLAQTIVQISYFLGLIAHAVLVSVDPEPRVRRRPPRF